MMNFVNEEIITRRRVSITNLLQEIGADDIRDEIVSGLIHKPKFISSKFLYNRKGSALFEQITRLEEYYPTRTEKGILKQISSRLMKQYGAYDIIELGPGDHTKISILMSAAEELSLKHIRYMPLDISHPALALSAENLVHAFPQVEIEGYAVDFTFQFDLIRREQPALVCFFGSTIGNFTWDASLELLKNISRQMKKDDVLLLGMDMIKAEPVLHAAYNDERGVTAAFNRNILNCVNELIRSDFNTEQFDHLSFFNPQKSRMEMYLVANCDLTVRSSCFNEDLFIKEGEAIHTENSHKYSSVHIQQIVEATGLRLNLTHTDEQKWFALAEFQKE